MCIGRKVTDLDSLKVRIHVKRHTALFLSQQHTVHITKVSNTEVPHKRVAGETVALIWRFTSSVPYKICCIY